MKAIKQIITFNWTICLLSLSILAACGYRAGPKNFHYRKGGDKYCRSKIYGYPDGKKKLAEVNIYKNDELLESTIYYELWPNDEGWKLVSKKGFKTVENGKFLLNDTSFKAPDNIIYKYFNNKHKEVIEVYKDGKRIPFNGGHYDGFESMQFLVDTPGIYKWKNGKEYFLRPFTEEEWGGHVKMNEQLNQNTLSDSVCNFRNQFISKHVWYLQSEAKTSMYNYQQLKFSSVDFTDQKFKWYFRENGQLYFSKIGQYDGEYYGENSRWTVKKDSVTIDSILFKIAILNEKEFIIYRVK